jgi:hypothetical protein
MPPNDVKEQRAPSSSMTRSRSALPPPGPVASGAGSRTSRSAATGMPTSLDLIEAAWGWDAARAYMSDLADFAVDTIAGAFSTLSGEHHDEGGDVMPAGRCYTVTFLALLPASPVTVDGVTAEVRGQDGRWSVRVDAVDAVVRTGPLRVGADPTEAARVILEEAQAGNPEKLEAWEIVRSGRPTADRLVELQAVDLPASVLAAVAEVVGSVTSATS